MSRVISARTVDGVYAPVGVAYCGAPRCANEFYVPLPDPDLYREWNGQASWRLNDEQREKRQATMRAAFEAVMAAPIPNYWVRVTSKLLNHKDFEDYCGPRCARLALQRIEKGELQ